ncbi:hypothetical protein Q1695_001592 [Nippostrongylus brasiliensis]|nr:hypothetical protein Q1695_001592 [Nippostrongylus brasiliensis]
MVGCACNLLLLYVFLSKSSSNPFQTFLAFLDFMLCFLFITCFGALSLSTTFRIEWLYMAVKTSNVQMLIASRMVQLCIPYILIANTAFRLASITGTPRRLNRGRNLQATVLIIATIVAFVRLPGYFFIQIVELPHCDFFESLILTGREMDPVVTRLHRISDVFIQFLHLFVSFLILCVLNCIVVQKLHSSHQRARRQSSCPSIFHATKRSSAEEEERREHKRLRCAVKTTIVIISSYLACNSVNFILYCIEMFNSSLTQDEDGNFNVFYVVASDLGTNLFVLSSTIRIFVYYKYNPAIRTQILSTTVMNFLLNGKGRAQTMLDDGRVVHRPQLELSFSSRQCENDLLSTLSTGTLKFPGEETAFTFTAAGLRDCGRIGSGNFGSVYKMVHVESGREMAVKRIRCNNINNRDQEKIIREHDTIMRSEQCMNIVKFFGAILHEGDCWICMELMDISLDILYKRVYNIHHARFEENVIGHVAVSVIDALDYLKCNLEIIHRDVKPSNILVNRCGMVKLCDFGISGQLIDSLAKTHDAGCQPYLAPERLSHYGKKYDIRSDIWSLGITLYEIATGEFPYPPWKSVFDQLSAVVQGDPPMLNMDGQYSKDFVTFVSKCLTKECKDRPKYQVLKMQNFYIMHANGGASIDEARNFLRHYTLDYLHSLENGL